MHRLTGAALVLAAALNAQPGDDVSVLKQQVGELTRQIEDLRREMAEQRRLIERLTGAERPAAWMPAPQAATAPAPQQERRLAQLEKRTEGVARDLGGFRFSGDFRHRLDIQARSGNALAAPLQNIRSRYRLRLNIDKQLDPHFRFHLQLSTSPLQNAITNDQDMAGVAVRHPFSIAEAWVDFDPHKNVSLRGGRMEDVFADHMRFLWDDDVRFNGFHQILRLPIESRPLGIRQIEFRAGQYFLTNPNIAILAPGSPFVDAGFEPGKKVRAAQLFHPGVVAHGDMGSRWSYQATADAQLYRNPNQIQLASTARGFPALVNPAIGLMLSGPPGGTGNATTTPGGAIFSAGGFQIVRLACRLDYKGLMLAGREVPAWLDFQVSRNAGADRLRDAFIASANLGAVGGPGQMRFLYQYAIKDANSMISQFTDDDLGTGSGVNIAVHALRYDLGLTRFLQWQNLLFFQSQRRASNLAERIFVPLPRGANTTLRYLGQLAFTF